MSDTVVCTNQGKKSAALLLAALPTQVLRLKVIYKVYSVAKNFHHEECRVHGIGDLVYCAMTTLFTFMEKQAKKTKQIHGAQTDAKHGNYEDPSYPSAPGSNNILTRGWKVPLQTLIFLYQTRRRRERQGGWRVPLSMLLDFVKDSLNSCHQASAMYIYHAF